MELRTLGTTGVRVSPLCLGAMMFGAWGNPDHDESIQDHPPRARRRHQLHRHRRRLLARGVGGDRRQGARRRAPRQRDPRHQGPRHDGRRSERVRQLAPVDHQGGREQPPAAADRLDRPLPDPPARGRHRRSTRPSARSPTSSAPARSATSVPRPSPRARSSRPSGSPRSATASGSCASSRRTRSSSAPSRTTFCRRAGATGWA